jgi:hypothetical protein
VELRADRNNHREIQQRINSDNSKGNKMDPIERGSVEGQDKNG